MMRALLLVLAVIAAGCRTGEESDTRVDRCVERFLERVEPDVRDEAQKYVRMTYCEHFDRRGWVYPDGALRLAAVTESGTEECAGAGCEPTGVLDCALLHLVRRQEVQTYVGSLARPVECDDGTPLGQLGS